MFTAEVELFQDLQPTRLKECRPTGKPGEIRLSRFQARVKPWLPRTFSLSPQHVSGSPQVRRNVELLAADWEKGSAAGDRTMTTAALLFGALAVVIAVVVDLFFPGDQGAADSTLLFGFGLALLVYVVLVIVVTLRDMIVSRKRRDAARHFRLLLAEAEPLTVQPTGPNSASRAASPLAVAVGTSIVAAASIGVGFWTAGSGRRR